MSQCSPDDEGDSPPLRRGHRYRKVSKRAETILHAGEAVPGISPDRKVHSHSCDSLLAASTVKDIAGGDSVAGVHDMAPRARSSDTNTEHDGLGPYKFAIYFWKVPRPTDFLNLPDPRKRWKADVDRAERQIDIDDGADEWDGFSNSLPDRGIASCFVKRAKRAFWASKTWEEFEIQERSLNLQTLNGGVVSDSHTLENARRMEIFEALKVRLCEEIWLQPYVGDQPSENNKPATAANGRLKTVAENIEPNKEDRVDGIVAWSRNHEGVAEPWYAGETINPSGLDNMMQYYKAQSMADQAQSSRQSRLQQQLVPQIEYTNIRDPARANNAAERGGRSSDSSASDEGRGRERERDLKRR